MLRHVARIFRSDFSSWLPIIVVVALVSTLIGVCLNQFVWTTTEAFVAAATGAGVDPAEFGTVSLTIYVLVALLTLVSLTIVGAATVEHTRGTFAQWRLVGASPRQVRGSLWALVGIASALGALPGSLLSIGLSYVAVPLFNQMAALSFPAGTAQFDPPHFVPSLLAWVGALVVAVGTCFLGATGPARRAAGVEPLEAVRDSNPSRRMLRWPRLLIGLALIVCAAVVGGGVAVDIATGDLGTRAGAAVNSAIIVGLLTALAGYAIAPMAMGAFLDGGRVALGWSPVGRLAARAAHARVDRNANMIAPLAAAIGTAAMLFTVLRTYERLVAAAGYELDNPNYVDTAVMTGLFAGVALLTSVAVISLSGRDAGRDQAVLRAAGLAPRQVTTMLVLQNGLLALCTGGLALIPVACASLVMSVGSVRLVGAPILVVPGIELGAAVVVCWAVLFAGQRLSIAPWLARDVAFSLRAT